MEVDYVRLRNIYRLEKQSKTRLTMLEPDFYKLLGQYIKKEKAEVARAWEQQEIERLVSFANLVKLVDDLISVRQRKIVYLALVSVFDEFWEPENLVGWEEDLYRYVVETIRKYREDALSSIGLGEKKVDEPREEKALNLVRVKILQTIPKFVGTDYKTYGPYSGGETVDLPPEIADILLVRKFAEVVKDEEDSNAHI